MQEIDKIAILQSTPEEKLQICNLTANRPESDTTYHGCAVRNRENRVAAKQAGNDSTVLSPPACFGIKQVLKF